MLAPFRVILAETRKGLRILWYYKFNMLTQLITLSVIFIVVLFFIGNGSITQDRLSTSVLGFIVWFYTVNALTTVGIELAGEAQAGTLEQMYMAIVPSELILVGRALTTIISTTCLIVLFDLGLILFLHTAIPMSWQGLLVFLVTLVGLFGTGLIIAGATLIFKHVHDLANLIINMFIFLNGTLLPIERLPRWLASVATTLPSTQGIILLREVVLNGRSLGDIWADGRLLDLLLNSGMYLLVGWGIFKLCERIAQRQGSLGQY
jgi:ABC-2 type transport system permease protein